MVWGAMAAPMRAEVSRATGESANFTPSWSKLSVGVPLAATPPTNATVWLTVPSLRVSGLSPAVYAAIVNVLPPLAAETSIEVTEAAPAAKPVPIVPVTSRVVDSAPVSRLWPLNLVLLPIASISFLSWPTSVAI